MKNAEIATVLFEIADLLEIKEVPWKPIAYRRAARTIETLAQDIGEVYRVKGVAGLRELSGVGEHIAQKIVEFLETGEIKEYKVLVAQLPKGVEEIMHIPGLGPKRAKVLVQKLHVTNTKELEDACVQHRVCKLAGFGEKSEADILRGITLKAEGKDRVLLGMILSDAQELAKHLKDHAAIEQIEVAGSIRRMKETCRDIDILVTSKSPQEVMDYFTTLHEVKHVLAKGKTKSTVILDSGIQADVRVLHPKSFGAALQYFTGSKEHNVALRVRASKKGYKLSEYGLFDKKGKQVAGRTEKEIYKKLGLEYVLPELRENWGELEVAQKKGIPDLIPYGSMKGDLHMHTTWSDGNASTEVMIQAARDQGYEYVAITDHSVSERIANGLTVKRLLQHKKEVEQLRRKYPAMTILFGSEVSIKANGELDYPSPVLKQLDWVIASVHSRFKSSKEEMTKRILNAVQNPYVHVLGHPTGRLILSREPYAVDLEQVYQCAVDHQVLLEINASPTRLDLSDINIKQAKEQGACFVISTDSHAKDHLRYMKLGVAQARRGWLESEDVINTFSTKKFLKRIAR